MTTFFIHLAFVILLIFVHEAGHYLVGIAAGIPKDRIKIKLLTFPQYVAIRQRDRWFSPSDINEYSGAA